MTLNIHQVSYLATSKVIQEVYTYFMKFKRFYVPQALGEEASKGAFPITLTSQENLLNQLKNVFRLKSGDQVIFFDNSGYDFLVNIDSLEKDKITFTVLETIKNNVTLDRDVYLFSSIIKKDNFEWVAQKATELGVTYIVPILSERSEKKDLNFERLNKIIIEASEQSGRGVLPVINEILDLEDAIKKYSNLKTVAMHTAGDALVSQNLKEISGVYIGPEGGWSEREIEVFNKNEIPVFTLGPQVLRAETAVIAALAKIVF